MGWKPPLQWDPPRPVLVSSPRARPADECARGYSDRSSIRFSELAGVVPGPDDDWFDPVLTEDTPLYVDPFLVFDDQTPLFADAHECPVPADG